MRVEPDRQTQPDQVLGRLRCADDAGQLGQSIVTEVGGPTFFRLVLGRENLLDKVPRDIAGLRLAATTKAA